MDLIEAMRTTAAVRAFEPTPVDDETVARILDAARFAPSGGNRQGWTVIVVKDPAVRAGVRDLCVPGWREYMAHRRAGKVPFAAGPDGCWHGLGVDSAEALATPAPSPFVDDLHTVPVLLVVTVDMGQLSLFDAEADRVSIIGGASIYPFCHNVLLAARTFGLAGVLTTFLARREAEAKALLHVPAGHAVAAVLALGRPAPGAPTKLSRRPVDAFARIDAFDGSALGAMPAGPPGR